MIQTTSTTLFSFNNNNNNILNNRKALSIVNPSISSHHPSSPLNKLSSLSSSLIHKSRISSSSSYSSTQLHLWFLKKKEENKDDDDDDKNNDNDNDKDEPSTKAEAEAEAETKVLPPKEETKKKAELDPVEYAQELKRQATKARLEADKMDAILTLEKISLLESKLKKAMSIQEESEIENESVSTSSENNDGDDKKKTNN
eukprot:CAMPEP_0178961028 /NCGR_PEP_ID=MMETSP0789-20121207/13394_1 /TAXON_ID=3005 /ORGANISM="Rhizosolenia setigera, Strain CCMP 1694" /LENGTH=199 /DNA_ID=CAMNT_0020644647 /DNA_START=160 /DNA_END=756 /DNA_ORIENTATION=+